MPPHNDDDRPKRSWKEIDQRRTGAHAGSGASASSRTEARPSYAYNAYKNQLGKLFDQGGMVPGAAKSESASVQTAAERALLIHTHPKALQTAALAYEATHGLPADVEVLMALLTVAHEPLVLRVVTALATLVQAGGIKRTQALKARLQALLLDCDAPKITAQAKSILAAL